MRQRIVTGEWKPGDRLPSREVFEQELGASRVTVQRVFDRLVQEGFVEVNGRRDTRVSLDPPHLSRLALAFPTDPSSRTILWNRFWGALHDVSMGIRRPDDSPAIQPYFNIDGHTDVRDYERLLVAMRHNLVAGIIFPTYPSPLLQGSPLITESGMPKVAIAHNLSLPPEYNVSLVELDNSSFFVKACEYLKSRNCKTVGLILPAGMDVDRYVLPALAQFDLSCPHYWMHRVTPSSSEVVSSIVPLMLRHASDRPAGLIIANDHFAEAATRGLIAAGVRVPDDIHVVMHENFPAPTTPLLPYQRLGFDARRVINACTTVIKDHRAKSGSPTRTTVPALFEYEL